MASAKIDLKIFTAGANGGAPSGFRDQSLIPVFHRWIQRGELDELMIDVADYSHVPDGPSILLICHDAHYSLDRSGGELGLLYSRRRETRRRSAPSTAADDGDVGSARFGEAFEAALEACVKLEGEAALGGELRFPCDRFLLRFNDRRVGADAGAAAEKELRAVLTRAAGEELGHLDIVVDSCDRLSLRVAAAHAPGAQRLLDRLSASSRGGA